jgi:low density lipoprotein receptor-related protein 5/6
MLRARATFGVLLFVAGFGTTPARSGIVAEKMYVTINGEIQRSNLDGSEVESLVTGIVRPEGLALDLLDEKVYWTQTGGGPARIRRANLDGSAVEDFITTGLVVPQGIAVDSAAGHVYWTNNNPPEIQRANLDGGGRQTLVTGGTTYDHITLDTLGGKMYWVQDQKIGRSNLDGSAAEFIVSSGLHRPRGIAVHADSGHVYWSDYEAGRIERSNLDGSNRQDVLTGLSAPYGITFADGKMYWVDYLDDVVRRANLDGTAVELVASAIDEPQSIAIVPIPEPALGSLVLIALMLWGRRQSGKGWARRQEIKARARVSRCTQARF